MTIDLSDAALARLLETDAQRTPGTIEAKKGQNGQYDLFVHVAGGDVLWFAVGLEEKKAQSIAAAVNHLTPLCREIQRLRADLERAEDRLEAIRERKSREHP